MAQALFPEDHWSPVAAHLPTQILAIAQEAGVSVEELLAAGGKKIQGQRRSERSGTLSEP